MPRVVAPLLEVLENVTGDWHLRKVEYGEVLKLHESQCTSLVFASSRLFLDREDLRSSLSTHYTIPRIFWTPVCQESNGFFGSEDLYGSDGSVEGHATWFRYIIKQVDPKVITYSWSQMSFYTKWTSSSNVVLCFDVPRTFQMRMHQAVVSHQQRLNFKDIYAGHILVLDEILALFAESVWALRDELRRIEKSRNAIARPDTDYPFLHDLARHVIHSTETLGVALDTANNMIQQHAIFMDNQARRSYQHIKVLPQTRQYMQFQRQMLGNLKARSEANQLRLQNEINFAFNTAAQSQSDTLLSINKGTRDDGAAMRAVALVTLTFLPATFVSAMFSMTFFNFSPANASQPEAWVVSEDFWIYWSVTIPLTAFTMAIWFLWRYWQREVVVRNK